MDKKEYIIRQLGRTKNKKYETYVVTRIIHLLNDFTIKFVTQQYVTRPEGRALTDLYFPQFGVHIEVDEVHHFHDVNIEADKLREAAIEFANLRYQFGRPIASFQSLKHKAADMLLQIELAKSGALTALGIEPVTETPAQFKAYIAAEVKEGTELLKDAGFRPE